MTTEYAHKNTPKEKEAKGERLFMLVKPDGGRYLTEIEQTLNERNIFIADVYAVSDWERIARAMYQKQLQESSRSFRIGFDSHVWLCRYLFGNDALLLLLNAQATITDWNLQVKAVYEARNGFRNKYSASSNGTIAIAINLNKLEGNSFRGSGIKKGHLGISQPNSFDPLFDGISKGRWDGNNFKYVHAPENFEELTYQYQALSRLDVMSEENRIDKEEWEILKQMHCLVPPSKFVRKINS
jgi:hypothetical protein